MREIETERDLIISDIPSFLKSRIQLSLLMRLEPRNKMSSGAIAASLCMSVLFFFLFFVRTGFLSSKPTELTECDCPWVYVFPFQDLSTEGMESHTPFPMSQLLQEFTVAGVGVGWVQGEGAVSSNNVTGLKGLSLW